MNKFYNSLIKHDKFYNKFYKFYAKPIENEEADRWDMFISGPNGGFRSEKGLILQIHVCPGFRSRQPSRVAPM